MTSRRDKALAKLKLVASHQRVYSANGHAVEYVSIYADLDKRQVVFYWSDTDKPTRRSIDVVADLKEGVVLATQNAYAYLMTKLRGGPSPLFMFSTQWQPLRTTLLKTFVVEGFTAPAVLVGYSWRTGEMELTRREGTLHVKRDVRQHRIVVVFTPPEHEHLSLIQWEFKTVDALVAALDQQLPALFQSDWLKSDRISMERADGSRHQHIAFTHETLSQLLVWLDEAQATGLVEIDRGMLRGIFNGGR